MKLCIPKVNSRIRLLSDWAFDFSSNYTNFNFWEKAFPSLIDPLFNRWNRKGKFYTQDTWSFGLHAGSILKVFNIYISRSTSVPNRIAFTLDKDATGVITNKVRVLVTLDQANNIEYEVEP